MKYLLIILLLLPLLAGAQFHPSDSLNYFRAKYFHAKTYYDSAKAMGDKKRYAHATYAYRDKVEKWSMLVQDSISSPAQPPKKKKKP